jgi:hypothetical protein
VALEGLLCDLQHYREPLLDRRLAGAVDRRAGVGSTVATVEMSTIRPPSRRRAGWRSTRPWRDRHGVVERLLGRLSDGHQRRDPAMLTRRSRAPRRRPASSNSRRTVRQFAEVGPDRPRLPARGLDGLDNLVGGGPCSTKLKTTAAPSRARRSTTARPIPREPQVTSARFPVGAPIYAGRSRRAAARSGNTLATLAVR